LLAAASACAGLLGACGSSTPGRQATTASTATTPTDLDTARIAASIERSILSERHLSSHVVCPSPVVQEAGVKFDCTATIAVAKKPPKKGKKPAPAAPVVTPFEVTVQTNQGYVTYVGR